VGEAPKHGRAVSICQHRPLLDEARKRQETEAHKAALRRRMKVERKLGRMLNVLGLRHCRYRGVARFEGQLAIVALVVNSEQLVKLRQAQEQPPPAPAQAA
jgi:hypothetical protein